jgi:drug/metabolite transporter (DMT)-like permease
VAIILSLLAATAYGLSDFIGGVLAKRANAWAVAFAGALGGSAAVAVVAAIDGGDPQASDYWWSLLAGIGNGLGTAFLYRGLSSGRMGVVAPVSGVGAALLPVAVGVASGERPGLIVWTGMLVALPAIWLVASEPAEAAPDAAGTGLVYGVLAGLGFGTLFAALAQIPEESGFLPLAVNQLIAAAVIVAMATALRTPWVPRAQAAYAGAACGILGVLATGLFLLATQSGYLTISAVITSLYPAFTVVLAFSVLREYVHRAQIFGLALCAVAVALVAAG